MLVPAGLGQLHEDHRWIEKARSEGVNLYADQYPYTACGGGIGGMLMPKWSEEGGRQAMLARLADPVIGPRVREGVKRILMDVVGGPRATGLTS